MVTVTSVFALTLALLVGAAQDEDDPPKVDPCGGYMYGTPNRVDSSKPGPGLYGYSIACGDLDGDGTADLVVGAPRDTQGGWFTGSVEAWSGKTGKQLWRINGSVERQCFGWSVTVLDDLDGDKSREVVVGSLFGNRVLIVSGKDGSTLREYVPGMGTVAWGGACVAALGDLDADGVQDIGIGVPREAMGIESMGAEGFLPTTTGGAVAFSGWSGAKLLDLSDLFAEPHRFEWEDRIRSHYGSALAAIGDIDADGVSDFAVGAPGEPLAFFAGRPLDHAATDFCRPMHLEDLLAQPLRDICNGRVPGRVWIHSGKDGSVLRTLSLGERIDAFGCALAGPGDLDGDAVPDLVVGAFRDSRDPHRGGSATAFSGTDGRALWTLRGHQERSELGFSLCTLPDLDGDGAADLAIGDPCERHEGTNHVGSVLLVSGRSGKELSTLVLQDKDYTATDFGFALACPGDLDGDGAPELFVTALQEIFGGDVFGFRASDGKPYSPLRHLASW